MALRLTATSSRVKKNRSTNSSPFRRKSPFAKSSRIKSSVLPKRRFTSTSTKQHLVGDSNPDGICDVEVGELPHIGPSRYIAQTTNVKNVLQAIDYIRDTMFADMPTSRVGMNSTRIADILNFRRALPPVVAAAHVHMLLDDPTAVEKQILSLIEGGVIRRIVLPGRGNDAASLGECLVVVDDWKRLVQENTFLDASLKDKYINLLGVNRKSCTVDTSALTQDEISSLLSTGFFVGTSAISWSTSIKVQPAPTSSQQLPVANPISNHVLRETSMSFSIPNLGPYLRLLSAARTHLLGLLRRSSSNEAPLYLLRDRWCVGVESSTPYKHDVAGVSGKSGPLRGRTKMWKDLYGLNFRWVLEEAVGAGLVELFDTGSVGPGVRRLFVIQTETDAADSKLGDGQTSRKLVAPVPLHIDSLPLHENLASASHALARPTLQSFLETVLREGMDFIHEAVPKMPHYKTVTFRGPGPAKTEVLLSKATLDVQKQPFPTIFQQDGQPLHDRAVVQRVQEYWIARKSIHPNVPLAGTASWEEFCVWAHAQYILNAKLFINHLCDVPQVGHYDCAGVEIPGFSQISARGEHLQCCFIVEHDTTDLKEVCLMVHRFGPRVVGTRKVFPVLIVSAIRSASFAPGFIQVQLPLDPDALHTGWQRYVPRGSAVGQHTSIQYLKLLPLAQGRPPYKEFQNATTEVHWTLAIAADGESRLPSFLRMADSPQIMADEVSWFLKWAQWRRKVPVPCQNLISLAPCKIVPNYRYCNHRHRPTETVTAVTRLEGAVSGLLNFMDHCDRRIRHLGPRTPATRGFQQGEITPSDPRVTHAIKSAKVYNVNLSTRAAHEGVLAEDLSRQETRSGVLTWDIASQEPSQGPGNAIRGNILSPGERLATAPAAEIQQTQDMRWSEVAVPWSCEAGPSGLSPSARPPRTPPDTQPHYPGS
ncbi:hypothetical protein KEM54_003353 [Ascosphaera aggregata]|nr:hypothetical protein KEM54_003353 [Ascosphaera aggregata]